MTVEQLIELLEEQFALAQVFVRVQTCVVGAAPGYKAPSYKGVPAAVYHDPRTGHVYIEARDHDC